MSYKITAAHVVALLAGLLFGQIANHAHLWLSDKWLARRHSQASARINELAPYKVPNVLRVHPSQGCRYCPDEHLPICRGDKCGGGPGGCPTDGPVTDCNCLGCQEARR